MNRRQDVDDVRRPEHAVDGETADMRDAGGRYNTILGEMRTERDDRLGALTHR
jgi:hypothetical protein